MGEVIHVALLGLFKAFPILLVAVLIFVVILLVFAYWKHMKATGKVAIRRGKEYCENSSVINKVQHEVNNFTEEVKAELKPQAKGITLPTSSETLTKSAKNLPTLIIGIVAEVTQYFESALLKDDLSVDDRDLIGKDIFALTLHLTDRILYASLGAKNRNLLMDSLLLEIEVLLYESKAPSIFDYYNDKSDFYSQYGKLVEGKIVKHEGVLFFDFADLFIISYGDARDPSSTLAKKMRRQVITLGWRLSEIINDALINEGLVHNKS